MKILNIQIILLSLLFSPAVFPRSPEPLKICVPFRVKDDGVYLYKTKIEVLDYSSFETLADGIIKDKNYVFLYDWYWCNKRGVGLPELKAVEVKDVSSFEILGNNLAKDRQAVYRIVGTSSLQVLQDIDPSLVSIPKVTVKISEKNTGGTALVFNRYSEQQVLEIAKSYSPETYLIEVDREDTAYYKTDKDEVFYTSRLLENVRADNFYMFSKGIGVGNNSVYVRGKKVFDLDGKLTVIPTQAEKGGPIMVRAGFFARDDSKVFDFTTNKILTNVDAETLVFLSGFYAKDKSGVYYHRQGKMKKITTADTQSFDVLSHSGYGKDKNYVYYAGEIIPQADQKTFKIIKISSVTYGRDKNNTYSRSRVVAIDEMDDIE